MSEGSWRTSGRRNKPISDAKDRAIWTASWDNGWRRFEIVVHGRRLELDSGDDLIQNRLTSIECVVNWVTMPMGRRVIGVRKAHLAMVSTAGRSEASWGSRAPPVW